MKLDAKKLAEYIAKTRDTDDLFPGASGGFHASQDRTLASLAEACKKRDIVEVQRLALFVLTWWNREGFTPLDASGEIYQNLAARFKKLKEER